MQNPCRALFVSHGGGPLPLLGDEAHTEMVSCLEKIAKQIPKPSAIIIISAHWEAQCPTLTAADSPGLIYDYYGFPEESYQIQYPCPGEPTLAKEICQLMEKKGFPVVADSKRGLDHGVFVPLKIMYPEADIPCVQLSLIEGLDAQQHIKMGRALSNLKDKDYLLLGSGFSFHNMKEFFAPNSDESMAKNQAFEDWLMETCCSEELSEEDREQRLVNWQQAPAARFCHPREEHLIPLHVCYGFAQAKCIDYYPLSILNKRTSMYLW